MTFLLVCVVCFPVVDSSSWPNLDFQHLSLEDSWRLRVSSAQVYYIMKNRDMENFDRVMDFLEATHNLLPKLLAGIKHMKIMFGLKTMVGIFFLNKEKCANIQINDTNVTFNF